APAGNAGGGGAFGSLEDAVNNAADAVNNAVAGAINMVSHVSAGSGDVTIRRPTASLLAAEGAGRGEQNDAGGGAFYFAGTTEAPGKLDILEFAKGIAALGKEDEAQVTALRQFNRFKQTKAADQPTAGSPELYMK